MSLIYGLNSQLGIYLAADTRLTTKLPSGIIKIEDDFLKCHSFSPYMHCTAAGDASLASYLIQKIESSDLKNLPYFRFKEKITKLISEEIGFYENAAF